MANRVNIIGAGLAGSEASYYLLKRGYEVHLYERRPLFDDQAHHTSLFGELVCSNSLKNKALENACGLLKEEMRNLDSLTMKAAQATEVPSGAALGVDRDEFASFITNEIKQFPNLVFHNEEVTSFPEGITILATGPLTSENLMDTLSNKMGSKRFSFFDASAPIIKKESIDFSIAYYKDRWGKGSADYINCPFYNKEDYYSFVHELLQAEKAPLHSFDTQYFDGCMPVEVIASKGDETLRHGPLKPFGLYPEDGRKPFAVCQLRQDSKLGDCYNIVGFQTNLTYPEQKRVFCMIPGLENAEFIRYGLMHRNSYIDSPNCLNPDLSLKADPQVYVAGQLSGVEGYVESSAMGIIAAINVDRQLSNKPFIEVPKQTILGGLIDYILHCSTHFAPMNATWALLPDSHKETRDLTIQNSLSLIKSYWESIHE